MRPRRLTIRGLRSYRSECAIDFGERGLIAIVGDTGAGKSSILEAITYALYNATTWDQRAVGQLISDGAPSMGVELEFQARGEVWSVHRACHRAAGRPSTHRLRCLSDPAAGEYDSEASVNRQVERLMGMSYAAYRVAVVLPQGRFQTLLQETPSKRTAILEGIFRLTDLREVQTAAREQGRRADVAVGNLRARREGLLADPAGRVRELEAGLETLRRRESSLRRLHAERRRAETLRGHEALVVAPDGAIAQRLTSLVPAAEAIRNQIEVVERQAAEAGEAERRAAVAGEAAARRKESAEDLAAARQLLIGVRETLAELEEAGRQAEREQAELTTAAAALREAEAALPGLEATRQAADEAAAAAKGALEVERERRRQMVEALRAARDAAARLDAAAGEERRLRASLPALEERAAASGRLVEAAAAARDARQAALDEARRRDAAAHAAEGLGPGDPCPVCGRELTVAFQPPPAGQLGPLHHAVREADAELTRHRAEETTATSRLDEAGRRLADAVRHHEAAEREARERLEGLRLPAPAADLTVEDATLLASLDARLSTLSAAAGDRQREAEDGQRRLFAEQARVEAARTEQARRSARLELERGRRADRRTRCVEQLGDLPPVLAHGGPVEAASLEGAIETATALLATAREDHRELTALRARIADLARTQTELQRRFREEVEAPRGAAQQAAAALLVRVNDGLGELGVPTVEAVPSAADLQTEMRWAVELDRRAAELRHRLREEIDAAEGRIADAATRLELGLTDRETLDAELQRTREQVGGLQRDVGAAGAQVPVAAELDGRIATGEEIRDSLSELARLLQDSQFVGHVIQRRQRQLLVVASQILGSMTGNAYGFSSDFDIVDRYTNQPRPTRTLSGGETFLASLALALALVEIAGRSGTQLDALFLDEGFGSLDTDALDEALSALERQASEGRLVAVVSHVRAVAERIETVLEVTRSPIGSRAEWRGAAERELMLAGELEARLLA